MSDQLIEPAPMDGESLEDYAKKKGLNAREGEILSKLIAEFKDSKDSVSVTGETETYFLILVDSHGEINGGYTGGAVQWKVDRKTGEKEMDWHESPMPSQGLSIDDGEASEIIIPKKTDK